MQDSFLSAVADRVAPDSERWWSSPSRWASDCIPALELTPYQCEVLDAIPAQYRIAVRGPHGLGKTTLASVAVLWFATTRDLAGADWKVPTTASTWRQLTKFLWPEVHKWAKRIDWEKLGREPFRKTELLGLSLRLSHGEAFAAASDDHEKLEGAHADQLMYVFDEAKAIPDKTWDAAEGAFSGGGAAGGQEAFAVAISTPGEPQGRFYEIHSRRKGLEDWWPRHVKLREAITAGRIGEEWARQRRLQYGAESAVYLNRVEGEFAASEEDGVIPLSWVEAAVDRWQDFHQGCTDKTHRCDPGEFVGVGVDPARSGPDKTVLALRCDDQIFEVRKFSQEGTTQTSGRVAGVLDMQGGRAVVDVIGIGAGVVDQLRDQFGSRVVAFNASEATALKDVSGELGFFNKRAAAWWHLRERLDPGSEEPPIMLPPDEDLIGDLCTPKWMVAGQGKIKIEGKDDLRRRLGRSTDVADAVVQVFWLDCLSRKLLIVAPLGDRSANYWRKAG